MAFRIFGVLGGTKGENFFCVLEFSFSGKGVSTYGGGGGGGGDGGSDGGSGGGTDGGSDGGSGGGTDGGSEDAVAAVSGNVLVVVSIGKEEVFICGEMGLSRGGGGTLLQLLILQRDNAVSDDGGVGGGMGRAAMLFTKILPLLQSIFNSESTGVKRPSTGDGGPTFVHHMGWVCTHVCNMK